MDINISSRSRNLVAVVHNGAIYFREQGKVGELVKVTAKAETHKVSFFTLEDILKEKENSTPIYEGDSITLKF